MAAVYDYISAVLLWMVAAGTGLQMLTWAQTLPEDVRAVLPTDRFRDVVGMAIRRRTWRTERLPTDPATAAATRRAAQARLAHWERGFVGWVLIFFAALLSALYATLHAPGWI